MSHHLTESQLIEFRQAFSWFDKQNQGLITPRDLEQCLNSLGFYPHKSQLSQMIDGVITDTQMERDVQCIDFPEFLTMMAKVLETSDASIELKNAFEFLDYNGDGELELEELHLAFKAMGEDYSFEEIQEMMEYADFDSSGTISFEEFVKMMLSS